MCTKVCSHNYRTTESPDNPTSIATYASTWTKSLWYLMVSSHTHTHPHTVTHTSCECRLTPCFILAHWCLWGLSSTHDKMCGTCTDKMFRQTHTQTHTGATYHKNRSSCPSEKFLTNQTRTHTPVHVTSETHLYAGNESTHLFSGIYVEEILTKWRGDYDKLEHNHTYIQWWGASSCCLLLLLLSQRKGMGSGFLLILEWHIGHTQDLTGSYLNS